jgi:hypothetical protein
LHSLLHAGLSRRTDLAIMRSLRCTASSTEHGSLRHKQRGSYCSRCTPLSGCPLPQCTNSISLPDVRACAEGRITLVRITDAEGRALKQGAHGARRHGANRAISRAATIKSIAFDILDMHGNIYT